jgi:hypothetical protein
MQAVDVQYRKLLHKLRNLELFSDDRIGLQKSNTQISLLRDMTTTRRTLH